VLGGVMTEREKIAAIERDASERMMAPLLAAIEASTRPAPIVTMEDALRMVRRLRGWTVGRVVDDPDGWDALRADALALLDRAVA
jgi:hypothetical protein